jgi:hypothetical protein
VTGRPGTNATISVVSDGGEATVIQPDIIATNGVIHVIDTVIWFIDIDSISIYCQNRVIDPVFWCPVIFVIDTVEYNIQ